MSEFKFNYDDVVEALEADGIMQEPDANWIIEYMASEYGGSLDSTSNFVDNNYDLKIYSESTSDGYDIFWCTTDDKPYVCQDGFYYEDHEEWSEQAVEHMTQGGNVWIESHIWDDMEYDFNLALEQWWCDVYDDLHSDKVEEMESDGGEYTED